MHHFFMHKTSAQIFFKQKIIVKLFAQAVMVYDGYCIGFQLKINFYGYHLFFISNPKESKSRY